MNAIGTQLVGWFSALILFGTLVSQVVTQWRERATTGVSPWLFVGQLLASLGFVAYSALSHNIVFVITNILIAIVAVVGQYTYFRNRRSLKHVLNTDTR